MHAQTVEAIKQEWNDITPVQQRTLIWSYLSKYSTTDPCRWMSFLQRSFKIRDCQVVSTCPEHGLPN